ncbi:glycoside hydrolase family 15 protein [Angustibacter aerolatus]
MAALVGVVVLGGGTSAVAGRSADATLPLLTAGVGVDAAGRVRSLPAGSEPTYLPGTRVLRPTPTDTDDGAVGLDPAAAELAAAQRSWLAAGRLPGADGPYAGMVRDALLDLHTLTADDGAVVAGWPAHWRYVWPRDASFTAVAYARTGHWRDAADVLGFVQRLDTGVLQARYRPDGGGPPDARGVQADGTGWVLWAADDVVARAPHAERAALLAQLRPLVDRTSRAALTLTGGAGALPDPSPDYWEVPTTRVSLGTAAPLAVGLRAAARLQERLGDRALAGVLSARAAELEGSIRRWFGPTGYSRYLGGSERDAAVAFLMPPFTTGASREVRSSWRAAVRGSRRPAGGLAPGEGWRRDGVSWTPQTALAAWTAAANGDRTGAEQLLRWLDRHRTTVGALPEKVLADGAPAGPAPLAWTAAMTVLAVDALH